MTSSTALSDARVPDLIDQEPDVSVDLRSTLAATAGVAVIGGICLLTVTRAVAEPGAYRSAGAAAIATLGALAVAVSVVRWVPSLADDTVRTVPRRHAAALLAASIALAALALVAPAWRGGAIGVLCTLAVINVYLACWGYRSLFLLRRLVLFTVLSWPLAAGAVHEYLAASLTAPSDLVYRRLGTFGVASADEHPWRVLSAMTDHATVAVAGVVVLTLAASRLRLSIPAIARLVIGSALAMLMHHLLLLSLPIERYERAWWEHVLAGPIAEVAIAAVVAIGLFSSASALVSDEQLDSPSPDRDPEIFGAHDIAAPTPGLRFCNLVVPAAMMALVVMQP
ncbi:MAG: hypothetical protein Q8M22_00455 [Actinomycetota bacterium]|nr:hypothetical protein [Actinomycetota bacterium]